MGFEASKFGDGSATGAGNVTTQVHTHFGARDTEGAVGVVKTEGNTYQASWEFTGTDVGNAAWPLLAAGIPAGALITGVLLKVKEAFVLGGTSPTIEVGTEGSEATNGFTITEAQAEAVGTYNLFGALSGTWAAVLAAATTVGLAQAGTTPTVTDAGLAEVIVTYTVVGA